uniref:DUF7906 domain-containing protein n=1 Tax=Polytomella parva TaxID=51329 RepID=A0A7S0YD02_9CHLO|mmetsp:Transcript_10173/g.18838  ORF Transcript_10173/g.18838 Transcript_10173/m.18838 type:complete len:907 (+) Transcript_10173:103-2823(+)
MRKFSQLIRMKYFPLFVLLFLFSTSFIFDRCDAVLFSGKRSSSAKKLVEELAEVIARSPTVHSGVQVSDPFSDFSDAKQREWSWNNGMKLLKLASLMRHATRPLLDIEIQLVGFEPGQGSSPNAAPAALQRYLDSVSEDLHAWAQQQALLEEDLTPVGFLGSLGAVLEPEAHMTVVVPRIRFSVTSAPASVFPALSSAISREVADQKNRNSFVSSSSSSSSFSNRGGGVHAIQIPYTSVDDILRPLVLAGTMQRRQPLLKSLLAAAAASNGAAGDRAPAADAETFSSPSSPFFTLFLLNLPDPGLPLVFTSPADSHSPSSSFSPNAPPTPGDGQGAGGMWVGTQGPYAWVDVGSAGRAGFGHSLSPSRSALAAALHVARQTEDAHTSRALLGGGLLGSGLDSSSLGSYNSSSSSSSSSSASTPPAKTLRRQKAYGGALRDSLALSRFFHRSDRGGSEDHELMSELAALSLSAVEHLAWPPLLHSHPVARGVKSYNPREPAFSSHVEVVVMRIQSGVVPARIRTTADSDPALDPPSPVDVEELKRVLNAPAGLFFKGQEGEKSWDVSVRDVTVPLAKCDICAAAFYGSIRLVASSSASQLTSSHSTPALSLPRTPILDRHQLHSSLSEHLPEILLSAGITPSSPTHTVLPVLLFDLSATETRSIQIGGSSPVAAFSDMVVAVSTSSKSDSAALLPSKSVAPPHTALTTPVLTAILQTGWAIPHTALRFRAASGVSTDHRWVAAATRAAAAASGQLPWAQAAAMVRNPVVLALDAVLVRAARVLEALATHSPDGTTAFLEKKVPSWRRVVDSRVNMLLVKSQMIEALIRRSDWHAASAVALTIHHDVLELERMARRLDVDMTPKIECLNRTTGLDLAKYPFLAVLGAAAILYALRPSAVVEKRYERMM